MATDVLNEAMQRTARVMVDLKHAWKEHFAGPGMVALSGADAQKYVAGLSPQERLDMTKALGIDRMLEIMAERRRRNGQG